MAKNTYPKYLPSQGLNWRGVLKGVLKGNDSLQPLFEAFTNSLESIELRKRIESSFTPHVSMERLILFNLSVEFNGNTAFANCPT